MILRSVLVTPIQDDNWLPVSMIDVVAILYLYLYLYLLETEKTPVDSFKCFYIKKYTLPYTLWYPLFNGLPYLLFSELAEQPSRLHVPFPFSYADKECPKYVLCWMKPLLPVAHL